MVAETLRVYRIGWQTVAVVTFLCGSAFAQAAGQSFTIEEAGPPRPEIPYNLRKSLEKDGIRLSHNVNGIDFPLAELWPVRNLVVQPLGKTPAGVAYRRLNPGKVLAVLYLPKAVLDFRLQTVPQGFYLLRYARIDLDTGEHEADDGGKPSNAQYHDYVSLARLESGTNPSADLLSGTAKLSTRALAGQKIALLALPPLNSAYKMFPYAVSDDLGHCAVQFKLSVRLASGRRDEMGVALLLINPPNLSEED